jgi:hypothetical protein
LLSYPPTQKYFGNKDLKRWDLERFEEGQQYEFIPRNLIFWGKYLF